MGKFKFRLATLLRLREVTRDECQTQLAQAYRADEIVEHEQERIKTELAELENESRSAASPGELDVDRLLEARRYGLVLGAQQRNATAQREAIAEEIERRRRKLVEANREVRVLEELRGKQQERHRESESRLEVKALDEVAARTHVREDEQ
jgi:flagellar protein FliJ